MASKRSKGRQKIAMVKMTKESNLHVTFSKRRSGLFKKASELCTLTGAEIAIIVFSPGNKVFSFGHPGVDSVLDRYLSMSRHSEEECGAMQQLVDARRSIAHQDLINQITQISEQLEAAKKSGETLKTAMNAERNSCWWQKPVDQMEKSQLEQLSSGLDLLKKKVTIQANKILTSDDFSPLLTAGELNNIKPNIFGFPPLLLPPPTHDSDEYEQKNVLIGGGNGGGGDPMMSMNNVSNVTLLASMMSNPGFIGPTGQGF